MSGEETRTLVQPVLAVRSTVLFPHLLLPLTASRPKSIAAVEEALKSEEKSLVVLTQRDTAVDDPGTDDLHHVGTLGVIRRMERSEKELRIMVQGTKRVELVELDATEPFLRGRVRELADPTDTSPEIEALQREILDTARRLARMSDPSAEFALSQVVESVQEPLQQVYMLASMVGLDVEKGMTLLRAGTVLEALKEMHGFLQHEREVAELQQKISDQANTEMTRERKEYLLRRQMRAIQEELGEGAPELGLLRERAEKAELPEKVAQQVEKELERVERLAPESAEYQVARSWLDLVLDLPWNAMSEDVLDLERARKVLDDDHFDLKEVKERILEHLAVMKLNPGARAPILCFVGPPGVGKTSLGQSIARAMDRRFERMSLGGMHDEAELRGHRRTYIGSMPGRILQAVRRAGVRNPMLMLDEVDKLGRDFRGDPAAALLEILDPAQNHEFRDNYLDLPFDLSKVFFVTTANTLDSIPRPLLDRMEILRLSGYSDQEKKEIARRYLIARQLAETGVRAEQLEIPDDALLHVIRRYTREAGVRELERMLGRIARKAATELVGGKTERVVVRVEDLPDLLGRERFFQEKKRGELPAGVAPGLAWTEAGGEVLYVEAVLLPGGSGLTLTGHLGEVMKESARAAQSWVWAHASELGIDGGALRGSGAHVHVPAGAVPKDGPSAGVTMATALASAYSGRAARGDTAMTGEITLSGLVLPVGGVKEKVLAAHRAGMRRVILPAENENDLRELPDEVRDSMEFLFADRLEDVLERAVP